jgi:hypothetical protein
MLSILRIYYHITEAHPRWGKGARLQPFSFKQEFKENGFSVHDIKNLDNLPLSRNRLMTNTAKFGKIKQN